jgi:hypothetical protein
MTAIQKVEGTLYDIEEVFGLFQCDGCEDLADFSISKQDGTLLRVCTECRKNGGWL